MNSESKENIETSSHQNFIFKGQNSGNYTWTINDKQLIHNIFNAKNGKFFESDSFIMAKLKWQWLLYPNGDIKSRGKSVMIFLKLVSMPAELATVVLSLSIRCNKTMASWTKIVTFSKTGERTGWPNKKVLLSEWHSMNLKDLSIMVTININKIVLNDNSNYLKLSNLLQHQYNSKNINYKSKSQFIHKIHNKTMDVIKNSNNGKMFESAIFDNMWRLLYFPNGIDEKSKGYFSIYLTLSVLPPFITAIKAKCTFNCAETKDSFCFEWEFKYDVQDGGKAKFMPLTKINSLQSVTFSVDIEIINIVFVDEKNKDIHHIYDPAQIEQILSAISVPSQSINNNNNNEINSIRQQLREQNDNITEKQAMFDAKLDSLSTNMVECNNMMKTMQNNMNEITNQINDLRLIITEENKNDDLEDMKKEMQSIKENVNKMMNDKSSDNDEENKKQKAMKQWMINIVELPQYIDVFIENGFESLDIIKEVKMNELTMIGIEKLGHKIKITKEIAKLNQHNDPSMVYEGGTAYI